MELYICEKKSVAVSIAQVLNITKTEQGYLGDGNTIITWCYGHLVTIAPPEMQGYSTQWNIDELPMLPKEFTLMPIENPTAKKQLDIIKTLITKCTSIVIATDAGREGELIFRYVYDHLGIEKPLKRLWISSLTNEAISKGIKDLKKGSEYYSLYLSAKARSEADWLLGMNATRCISIQSNIGKVISLGRVQTPVLAMICHRFINNRDFVSKPYYTNLIELSHLNVLFKATNSTKYDKKSDAEAFINTLNSSITLLNIDRKDKQENCPLPYDLTELQKECNQKYSLSATDTLAIAQKFYDSYKITTYPRTDSNYLSEDMYPEMPDLMTHLSENFGELTKHLPSTLPKYCIKDAKVTDHHAIIPTNIKFDLAKLTDTERKVYNLIVKKFIAAFSTICIKSMTTYTFASEFTAKGSSIKEIGWRAIYQTEKTEGEEEKETDLPYIEDNYVNQNFPITSIITKDQKTTPHPMFSEATILAAMQNVSSVVENREIAKTLKDKGIGTSATRASIIETLVTREYITKEKKHLVPTPHGLRVFDNIKELDISKPDLTAEWEHKLALIESAEFDYEKFITEIKVHTTALVTEIKKKVKEVASPPLCACPKCGKGQVLNTHKGYVCENRFNEDIKCELFLSKNIAKYELQDNDALQLINNKQTDNVFTFISSKGKDFQAYLSLNDDYKIVFKFPEREVFDCPFCDNKIIQNKGGFFCQSNKNEQENCKFKLFWNDSTSNAENFIKFLNGAKITMSGKSKDGKKYKKTVEIDKVNKTFITTFV